LILRVVAFDATVSSRSPTFHPNGAVQLYVNGAAQGSPRPLGQDGHVKLGATFYRLGTSAVTAKYISDQVLVHGSTSLPVHQEVIIHSVTGGQTTTTSPTTTIVPGT
jgi:hypothetical protein